MRIKHRFVFRSDEKALIKFLDKQKVEYDKGEILSVIEMFEDNDNFKLINKFLVSHNALSTTEAVYTLEEIEKAKWLTVRSSWYNLYPQPQDNMNYLFTTYDATNYCMGGEPEHMCGKGLVQKECFVIKKEPHWGSRNFMMLNWVRDELFISKKAEEVLKISNLTGFEIYDVFNKSNEKLDNIKQIFIKTYIAEGFSADAIKEKYVCSDCNSIKYLPKTGVNRFHKEIFEGVQDDFVKTSDKFGGGAASTSMILVNNKFYNVVKEAKLDRGLVFEPVELV